MPGLHATDKVNDIVDALDLMPVHSRNRRAAAIVLLSAVGIALTARYLLAQTAAAPAALEPSFEQVVKPFQSELRGMPQLGVEYRRHPRGPARRQY
jgi:hypothetical protein